MSKNSQRSGQLSMVIPMAMGWNDSTCGFLPEHDVSIVLTLHNEARYLRRTLLSLSQAVAYARQFDITFELVVVMDNADSATTRLAENFDYRAFDACQFIHVCNNAAGLSRNDGISASRGDYIFTMDADDLVAFDFFQKTYMTSRSIGRKSIVFPEYYFAFGMEYYVYKFLGKEHIGNSAFFDRHPYVARVMFPRELFDRVQNADISIRNGYAHEDWHFNSECLAAGYDVAIAADALVFYRERQGSMRRRFEAQTQGLIPKSRYFEPNTFLALTWDEFSGKAAPAAVPEFRLDEFIGSPVFTEIVKAANLIDPAISIGIMKYKSGATNFSTPGPMEHAYFKACRLVAGLNFTDVLLVPFLAKGGAEKYILSIIDAICQLEPGARLLVISTHEFPRHDWIDRLPEGSVFLDLPALGVAGLAVSMIEKIVFRLIQHVPGVRRVHMKNCEFVDAFIRKYSRYISDIESYFYYFCDEIIEVNGNTFTNGQSFDLITGVGEALTCIISDHAANIEELDRLVGREHYPMPAIIYNLCELPDEAPEEAVLPRRRLLWASRLDGQKRPDLARRIALQLDERGLNIRLDAYGGTTYGIIGPEVFNDARLLTYRGDFDGFAAIPAQDYDALIYTAAFDGLPNIILEALATGMPVIAPDIGGISEAITSETGYLLESDLDDEIMAGRYVEAVLALYADWPEALRRGRNGRRLIAERHSAAAHLGRVSEIFGLKAEGQNLRHAGVRYI